MQLENLNLSGSIVLSDLLDFAMCNLALSVSHVQPHLKSMHRIVQYLIINISGYTV